jgi:hypothetical protein
MVLSAGAEKKREEAWEETDDNTSESHVKTAKGGRSGSQQEG